MMKSFAACLLLLSSVDVIEAWVPSRSSPAPPVPPAQAATIEEVMVQTMQKQADLEYGHHLHHHHQTHVFSSPTALEVVKEEQPANSKTKSKMTPKKPWLQRRLEEIVAKGSVPSLQVTRTTTMTNDNEEEEVFSASAPLEREGAWTAYLDLMDTGLVYYFNHVTGESLWKPPTTTFPVVKLPPKLHCIAREKKRQCLSARLDEMSNKYGVSDQELKQKPAPPVVQQEKKKEELYDTDEDDHDDGSLSDMMSIYGGGRTSAQKQQQQQKKKQEDKDANIIASRGDWDAYWDDEGTGYVYFFNRVTGVVQWERPKNFPRLHTDAITSPDHKDQHSAAEPMLKVLDGAKSKITAKNNKRLFSYGDWTVFLDGKKTGRVYYYNHFTGETQWNKPTPDFPAARIKQTMRSRMMMEDP